jgi:hypothetical protein
VRPDGASFEELARRAIFVAGPARGGTTLLARLLGANATLYNAFTNRVYEHRALFNYRDQSGLCRRLLAEPAPTRDEVVGELEAALTARGFLLNVDAKRPGAVSLDLRERARRLLGRPANGGAGKIRLGALRPDARLVLKSPELCFVADRLAALLPEARFVVTYRPVEQVILSMWRKGREGWYWAQWRRAVEPSGRYRLPLTVRPEWSAVWQRASDLQRCGIRAISYFEALDRVLPELGERAVVCPHQRLLAEFDASVHELCQFLDGSVSDDMLAFRPQLDPSRAASKLEPEAEAEVREIPEVAAALDRLRARFSR